MPAGSVSSRRVISTVSTGWNAPPKRRSRFGASMFVWDETDFVACLEAIPEVEEYGVSHRFLAAKDGLRLELTVFRYAGDVFISLYRDGIARPIVDLRLTNCSGAAYDR